MAQVIPEAIRLVQVAFRPLPDRRVMRTRRHPLINILVIALCGAICGAEGWKGLAMFAKSKAAWFATFLAMPDGPPSADTFRRVLSALDPAAFEGCFRVWAGHLAQAVAGETVALDGKTVRGALGSAASKVGLHLLHAWATGQRLLLGQLAVDGAPGEVSGMVELIRLLDLDGAVVTTDANGCSTKVVRAILDKKAHYVLALKGNRGRLHDFVKALFEHAQTKRRADSAMLGEVHHGRTEIRDAWAIEPKSWPVDADEWPGLRTALLIERTREVDGKTTFEQHFYISDLPADAQRLCSVARAHWSVENELHWTLDVGFSEDRRRIRNHNGAQNYALLSRIALLMLKRDKLRAGIALKRQNAGWDHNYLLNLVCSGPVTT